MCCNRSPSPGVASITSQEILRRSSDGPGQSYSVPAGHNRVEIVVHVEFGVSTGDVRVFRVVANPAGGIAVKGLAATIAYSAVGGRWQATVPPGARIAVDLDNYGGSGAITAVFTSWREA